jgi:hypothetical protein
MTLLYYLYQLSQHLLGMIGGFFSYLIVYIGSVHYIQKEEVNEGIKVLSLCLPDLVYYEKEGIDFYYSEIYYLSLLLGLAFLLYFLRKNADLIN